VDEKRTMVALLVVREKQGRSGFYRAIKLLDDGSTRDVAQEDFEFALDWITSKEARKKMHRRYPWKPWGIWYNGAPGVVFAESREKALETWLLRHDVEDRLLPAPCTYQSTYWWKRRHKGMSWTIKSAAVFVGEAGVITPTLTEKEILRKRGLYPNYPGDLAMIPRAVLDEWKEEQRRRAEFTARIRKRAMAVA
jgi:hypothetical protein